MGGVAACSQFAATCGLLLVVGSRQVPADQAAMCTPGCTDLAHQDQVVASLQLAAAALLLFGPSS